MWPYNDNHCSKEGTSGCAAGQREGVGAAGAPCAFPVGSGGSAGPGTCTGSLFAKQVVLRELKVSTRWAEMMKEASA